jgi:hypothetical protein
MLPVVFVVILIACGGSSTSKPDRNLPPNSSDHAPPGGIPENSLTSSDVMTGKGFIDGTIVRTGADPRSGSGATKPMTGDPVDAYDAHHVKQATAISDQNGHFSMTLPTGSYTLVDNVGGKTADVTVRAGETTKVTITVG